MICVILINFSKCAFTHIYTLRDYILDFVDRVQDTVTQNMAPWNTGYFKPKEFEETAEAGRSP